MTLCRPLKPSLNLPEINAYDIFKASCKLEVAPSGTVVKNLPAKKSQSSIPGLWRSGEGNGNPTSEVFSLSVIPRLEEPDELQSYGVTKSRI